MQILFTLSKEASYKTKTDLSKWFHGQNKVVDEKSTHDTQNREATSNRGVQFKIGQVSLAFNLKIFVETWHGKSLR